ncbi:MAG: hypothetical protein R2824_14170 [Saprospiraceae bacterium]
MQNSKLFAIISSLDKYEENKCRKYIESPYFNRDSNIVKFFDLFVKEVNSEVPEQEKAVYWRSIFPNKEYNDVRFRKYCSDLLKLVEGFLAQQVYEETSVNPAMNLIEAVERRKIEKLYSGTMRSARKLLDNYPYRDIQFFFNQYLLEKKYYHLIDFDTRRGAKANVEEISKNLDYFFISEKLRLGCEVLSRQSIKSIDYELNLIEEIRVHLSENNYSEIPPVAIFEKIFLMYEEPENEGHYFELKELLENYGGYFPKEQANEELYMSAQNYCIKKINQGNSKFLKELFLLYKTILENEVILAKGELSPWYFRNIVFIGCRVGEFEWTESFVNTYNKYLPESQRANAVKYNLAHLYFYQKSYELVIENLRDVEFEDFSYNLNSKTMLIATYYELDEVEPLFSLFESFRTYLNRHKEIPHERMVYNQNLIKYSKKLLKIMPSDRNGISKLKAEVLKNKNSIASFNWLQEKIAELEGT